MTIVDTDPGAGPPPRRGGRLAGRSVSAVATGIIAAFAAFAAFAAPTEREAGAVTFPFAGAGLAFLGIGAAFPGLLAGGAMLALARAGRGGASTSGGGPKR